MTRRSRRSLIALGVVLALVGGACAMITQPVVAGDGPRSTLTIQPKELEKHVLMLVGGFGLRDHEHPKNLDKIAAWLADELRDAGGRVELQPYKVGAVEYRNVIARFGPPPGDGPQAKPRIIIGAHYDTCGPQPGADDNASGIAALLALAREFGRQPPPAPIELVAYTLEEPPHFRTQHMGSAVHADALARSGAPVRAMIALEMLGYFTDAPRSQQFPSSLLKLLYPTTGNYITLVGKLGQGSLVRHFKKAMRRATPLPVESISAPAFIPGIDFSDHLNYWKHGWPAIMVTDTAFYRNQRYHTPDDTPDTLDYQRMAQVVIGVHAAVVELAKH